MSSDNIRAHVIVHGKVQGVFFRYETKQAAIARGVSGWVRNLPDGTVEGVFEGPEESVKSLLAWCRQGPPESRVDKVDTDWLTAEGEFDGFRIRY